MTGRSVVIVGYPGLQSLDVTGPFEVFAGARRAAASVGLDDGYDVRLVSAGTGSVTSESGLTLAAGPLPAPRTRIDTLLLPGGRGVEAARQDEALVEFVRRTAPRARRVATVCSGAFLAAESGLLDGLSCTTHHSLVQRLARDFPRVKVLENRIFVRDGNVFTSAGVTAGVDLALHLISELAGAQVAVAVARLLVLYFRRSGADPQLSPWLCHRNHIDGRVHSAQDLVLRDPAHGWTVDELADRAHTSPRNLGRLFRRHAGISPQAYVRKIRTAAARELLAQPDLNVDRVAEMVGFSSAEQLRRAWKRFEPATPARHRALQGA